MNDATVKIEISYEHLSLLNVLVLTDMKVRADRGLDAQARGIDFYDPDFDDTEELAVILARAFMEIGADQIREKVTLAIERHYDAK